MREKEWKEGRKIGEERELGDWGEEVCEKQNSSVVGLFSFRGERAGSLRKQGERGKSLNGSRQSGGTSSLVVLLRLPFCAGNILTFHNNLF